MKMTIDESGTVLDVDQIYDEYVMDDAAENCLVYYLNGLMATGEDGQRYKLHRPHGDSYFVAVRIH